MKTRRKRDRTAKTLSTSSPHLGNTWLSCLFVVYTVLIVIVILILTFILLVFRSIRYHHWFPQRHGHLHRHAGALQDTRRAQSLWKIRAGLNQRERKVREGGVVSFVLSTSSLPHFFVFPGWKDSSFWWSFPVPMILDSVYDRMFRTLIMILLLFFFFLCHHACFYHHMCSGHPKQPCLREGALYTSKSSRRRRNEEENSVTPCYRYSRFARVRKKRKKAKWKAKRIVIMWRRKRRGKRKKWRR